MCEQDGNGEGEKDVTEFALVFVRLFVPVSGPVLWAVGGKGEEQTRMVGEQLCVSIIW